MMNSSAPPRKKLLSELKRICEEVKKTPRQFTSLDLSQTNLTTISKDLRKRFAEFTKLAELILYDCGLRTLEDLPVFSQLRSLSLIGNEITDKEIHHLIKYTKLNKLYLSQNNIQKVDVFHTFSKLFRLEHLQLEGNPVAYDEELYRETAFKIIPRLKSLDGYDIEGNYYVSPSDCSDEIEEKDEKDGSDDESVIARPKMRRKKNYQEDYQDEQYEQRTCIKPCYSRY